MTRDRYDDVPYDRELIRSGGVQAHRRPAPTSAPPRGRAAARPMRGRRPGGRRSPWRAVLLVAVVALIGILAGGVMLGIRAAAFNDSVSTADFASSALFGSLNGDEPVNILLIGYGGADHSGAFLADSIQLLSIDPASDVTTTIPIPRDLWIEGVAGFPQNGKINEVFATAVVSEGSAGADGTAGADGADGSGPGRRPGLVAGGDLMAEVLSDVTGLDVEHWLSIDFSGFRDMIDAVGGVTINNPVAFSWATGSAGHQVGNWAGSFPAGELHLDGEQALAYARARYTSVVDESTDFARSVRQSRVLAGLRSELGDGGIGSLLPGLRLMDAMEDNVLTDLSVIDLFLLSSHLSSDRRIDVSDRTILIATTNTIGQYILIPKDWTGPGSYGGLRAYLADELAKPMPAPSPTAAP